MTRRQILDTNRIKYKKVIKLAEIIFDFWLIEPETEIMIYDYFPNKYEAVTLSDNRVYILTITYNITDYIGVYMIAEPFRGFGKNGMLIV